MRGRGGPRPIVPVEEPYRINERIRVSEVRVIVESEDGEEQNLGVMATADAIKMAQEKELDLVEVAPMAQPPVCKIMDYGRFKYSMERKQREAHRQGRAGRAASEMKDVQLSPRIDEHDRDFKVERALRFLQEGHPVRMVVRFLGRDMRHPEVGLAALNSALEELGKKIPIQVDSAPRMEGRQMVALVKLAKGAKAALKPAPATAAAAPAAETAAPAPAEAVAPAGAPPAEAGAEAPVEPAVPAVPAAS
ncbi:MAG TPA: translation initiation factor IF-3 [Chloroflexota bacterium]|nr:translation initiation factor IF-3 [Chloroflexota bacterium]